MDNPGKVIVDSGNILMNDEIRGKIYKTSTDELIESICWTLNDTRVSIPNLHQTEQHSTKEQNQNLLRIVSRFKSKAEYFNETTKINCKLFSFDNTSCCVLHEAVGAVFQTLECSQIDQLIVCPSFDIKQSNGSDGPSSALPNDQQHQSIHPGIMKVWKCAERMVNENKVKSLGVSDFDLSSLEYLLDNSKIKPSSNQISSHLCCSLPADLSEFAAKRSIQLLTHNDKKVLLDSGDLSVLISRLDSYLGQQYPNSPSAPTVVEWIIRYTVQTTSTAVVHIKGYIVSFKRICSN